MTKKILLNIKERTEIKKSWTIVNGGFINNIKILYIRNIANLNTGIRFEKVLISVLTIVFKILVFVF